MTVETWNDKLQQCEKIIDNSYENKTWKIELNDILCPLVNQADKWHCCAIGEILEIPEPEEDNQKNALKFAIRCKDDDLYEMGLLFAAALHEGDVKRAIHYKKQIDKKLTPELIAKIKEAYAKELEYKGPFDFDY